MEPPKTVTARVLEVRSANTLDVDADGEERTVRLAGIVVPEPTDCMGNEAVRVLERHAGAGRYVDVTTVGEDPDGNTLVSIAWFTDSDLAREMVAQGVAVTDVLEEDLPPTMRAARAEAMQFGRGFFDEFADCTFAAQYAEATKALTEATEPAHQPSSSSSAQYIITALVAAIATGEAAEEFAQQAHKDLRMLAYPAARLTDMATDLSKLLRTARTRLRETRTLRRQLARKERRERLQFEKEQERIRRKYSRDSASSESSSERSSGSGSGYSGYTGPRCYEPGGKVWHPC